MKHAFVLHISVISSFNFLTIINVLFCNNARFVGYACFRPADYIHTLESIHNLNVIHRRYTDVGDVKVPFGMKPYDGLKFVGFDSSYLPDDLNETLLRLTLWNCHR
jgi:hypothetical protein